MDIETIRNYCMSLPYTSEDMPFGDEYLILRVYGKIFACIGLEMPDYFVVKCDSDYAIELRDRYSEIVPAWHWNKKYWNQISLCGSLSDELIISLVRHSYAEVVKKLPRRVVHENPLLSTVY